MISSEVSIASRGRTIRWVLALLTVTLAIGVFAWFKWQLQRQPATFDDVIELADAGKLDDAASKLRTYLSSKPHDAAANLLMAQVLLKRP
jgi:hypothetical protein